jgi:NTP pyrophosphatase (non-canonical NTP hydrolase)
MEQLQRDIAAWARETFPNQTDERIMAHLHEELRELDLGVATLNTTEIHDGVADCLILLLCLASRHGVDTVDAVRRKHAMNTHRTWRFDPRKGYDKHDTPAPAREEEE